MEAMPLNSYELPKATLQVLWSSFHASELPAVLLLPSHKSNILQTHSPQQQDTFSCEDLCQSPMPAAGQCLARATISDHCSFHVAKCASPLLHEQGWTRWMACAQVPLDKKSGYIEGVLLNTNLRGTHRSPSLDRASALKPCTAVSWSLRLSATLSSVFSCSVMGREVSLCMDGGQDQARWREQGSDIVLGRLDGATGAGSGPTGWGMGTGTAVRQQGWSWGQAGWPAADSSSQGLEAAGSQLPLCPPCCPGASSQDQLWEGVALSWHWVPAAKPHNSRPTGPTALLGQHMFILPPWAFPTTIML